MRRAQPSRQTDRGFTLLEVLLAAAVFSIVLVAVHVVFHSALRLRERTTRLVDDSLPLQQTLSILRRDLSNLVPPGGTFFGELQTSPNTGTQTNSTGSSSLSPATPTSANPGQSGPQFCTSTGVVRDAAPWGDVVRVTYYLADPTNRTVGRDLIRSVTRNLLPTLVEEPEDQWLMGGVESILFSFYDGNQWSEEWDSATADPKLPAAIRVELLLASEERARQRTSSPIALVVPVMAQVRTNSASSTNTESGGAT